MNRLEHIEVGVELLSVLEVAVHHWTTFPTLLTFSEAWVDDEFRDVDRICFRSLAQVANHSLVVDDCECLLVTLECFCISVSSAQSSELLVDEGVEFCIVDVSIASDGVEIVVVSVVVGYNLCHILISSCWAIVNFEGLRDALVECKRFETAFLVVALEVHEQCRWVVGCEVAVSIVDISICI